MADLDYPPVMLDDEEEQLRKRLLDPYSPPPIRPREEPGALAPDVSGRALPEAPPIKQPSATGAGFDTVGLNPHDIAPPVRPEGPAAARERTLLEQGPPQYHGWKRVLDTLGGMTREGRGLEESAGIGTLGYQSKLGRAAAASKEEQAQTTRPLDIEKEQAQTEETKALTEKARNAARVPPKRQYENMNQLHTDAVIDAQNRGVDPKTDQKVLQIEDAIQRIQKETPIKPDTATQEDQKYEDIRTRQATKKPVTADESAWAHAYEQRKTLGPALTAGAADIRQQRTFSQQERMFQLHQQALTNATKTMIEMAPTVNKFADKIEPLIDQLNDELGPGSGRWTEFWAGKIGAKDPKYTQLRTDLGLLRTALMRMHVGARGGTDMLLYFKDLIDQGKQNPENLKAALMEIKSYAGDLIEKGRAGGMSPAVLTPPKAGEPQRPKGVPEGAVWNDKVRRWQMPTKQ